MTITTADRLRMTVRVGADGTVEHGIPVPHEAANLICGQPLDDGLICRKRAGHHTRKGSKAHVAQDFRIVASPYPVVHTERFKPNMLPRGVDMSITLPHDCANHLKDVKDMEVEAYRRGR